LRTNYYLCTVENMIYKSYTMKRIFLAMMMSCGAAVVAAQALTPAIPRDEALEKKVENTLARMTLDEKVGQMLELNFDIMGKYGPGGWQLNETTLDTLISKYKVGSILNAPATRAHTVAEWQQWIRLIQEKSMKHIGIPDIYGLDHNHQPGGIVQHRTGTANGRGDGLRESRRRLSVGLQPRARPGP
jgi:beta-glucosidase